MIAVVYHVTCCVAIYIIVLLEGLPTPETPVIAIIAVASRTGILSFGNLGTELGDKLSISVGEESYGRVANPKSSLA